MIPTLVQARARHDPHDSAPRAGADGANISAAPLVSAVMPCLNEVVTLGACIRKAQRCFAALGVPGEVVVADNGSSDGSVQLAQRLGARVVHASERGYGAALRAGIEASAGRIVVMADSDDSYDWSGMGPFLDKIDEGFDLVMGNRFLGGIEPGAMPALHRYFGNPVLSFVARTAFQVPISDFHCGMRAFRKEAYPRMRVEASGMEFATEMVAGAARAELRIAEIPIRLYPDKRDRRPHLRSFRDGWRHLRFILMNAPDQLYLAPAAVMLATGIGLQALLSNGPIVLAGLYMGIHFVALGGLLSILGLNVGLMGLLAKLIVGQRHPAFAAALAARLSRRHQLEGALICGAALFTAGLVYDATLLFRWLTHPGASMQDTIHPAFIATHAMVLGANLAFGAFVLQLTVGATSRPHRQPAPAEASRGVDD